MKHNVKITIILLTMFIFTQLAGLYVANHYFSESLPYGMQPPEAKDDSDFYSFLPSIIIAFIIAICLVLLLSKFKIEFILKLWFFLVIMIAISITLNSLMPSFKFASILTLIFALPLALHKILRSNFYLHNATELMIYPGIAAVFIPILNFWTVIILLVIISIYDMWAVWHSGIMQKMAKYHINNLKIFPGFFVPYASKKVKDRIKKMSSSDIEKKKIKVNVAILGGGDIVFPIIASGVMLKFFGLIPALLVIFGATLGLCYLFFFAEKRKFYPAMPYITAGILVGMIISYLFF